MLFGIDATALGRPGPSGIRTILRELVPAMIRELGEDRLLLWQLDLRARSRPLTFPRVPGVTARATRSSPRLLEALWRRLEWPALETFTGPLDLFHSLQGRLPPSRRARLLLNINDLRHQRLPELYPRQRWRRREISRAHHFVAISETTRRDAMELLQIPPERITAIHLGPPAPPPGLDPAAERRARESRGLAGPYLFCPSSSDPRKNVPCALEAFSLLRRRTGCPHRLVVVGELHRSVAEAVRRWEDRGVVFTGAVSDLDYHVLLRGAGLMLQPSLSEGFGFPVLEAFQAGVPQAVAGNSSLPEVAGEAALTFDPRAPEEACAVMERLIAEPELARELARRGTERLREFSWERTARRTLELYRQVAARDGGVVPAPAFAGTV